MVTDVGFKKQLWALDPALDVVWDWAAKKWEIWRFPGQEKKKVKVVDHRAHHVMTVETKDKTFRELGADILLKLQAGDTTRFSVKELVSYFNAMDDNVIRANKRALENRISAITSEVSWFFAGHRVQVPKAYESIALKVNVPNEQSVARVV